MATRPLGTNSRDAQRHFLLALLATPLFLFLAATAASAYNVGPGSISVSPADPITESDPVEISIGLTTPTSSAIFTSPTTWSVTGNTISIDVYAATQCELSAPVPICDRAVGFLTTSVALGALAAGEYSVEVQTYRSDYFGTTAWDFETASFTVVPEPSAALLIGLSLAYLSHRRPDIR